MVESKVEAGGLSAEEVSAFKLVEGGVNTNDEATVQQYFGYYAKLVN